MNFLLVAANFSIWSISTVSDIDSFTSVINVITFSELARPTEFDKSVNDLNILFISATDVKKSAISESSTKPVSIPGIINEIVVNCSSINCKIKSSLL